MFDHFVQPFCAETQSQRFLQMDIKLDKRLMVDEIQLLFITIFDPTFLEIFRQVIKVLNRVIRRYVVLLEILHKHQNKQIQHNKLDHNDIYHKEDNRIT